MLPAFLADRENKKRKGHDAVTYVDGSKDVKRKPKKKERVLSAFGGGQPQAPHPMQEANAQMAVERERARLEAEAAARQQAIADQQRRDTLAQAAAAQQRAYDSALGYGNSRLRALGITDDYGIMDLYRSELDQARAGLDPMNVSPSFGTSLFDTAYDIARSGYRRNLSNEFGQFTGDDYGTAQFADTADDDILNSLLEEYFGDANSAIQRARDRGTLNDAGFTKAQSELARQKQVASGTLSDIGLGVLSGYRKQLNDQVGGYTSRINAADFGDNINLSNWENALTSAVAGLRGRMSGDIYKAVGDQTFFNTDKILARGTNAMGATNTALTPLQQSFLDQEEQKRTAGNTGVF